MGGSWLLGKPPVDPLLHTLGVCTFRLPKGLTQADTVDDHTDYEQSGHDAVHYGPDECLPTLCLHLCERLPIRGGALTIARSELVVRVDPLELPFGEQLKGH